MNPANRVLQRGHDGYPRRLLTMNDAPDELWVRGTLDDTPAVAIVGSRACTSYGQGVARDLAAALARRGLVVVSGLARGIDAAAHRGALDVAGGRTVAVLPGDIDTIYPSRHRALAEEILVDGALVTDQPPGAEIGRWSFPSRNRIIAGLSLAVVVVEAAAKSGARITADLAVGYDREVLVVPGRVTSPTSEGCHHLLAQGAHPCTGVDDVIEQLPTPIRAAVRERGTAAETTVEPELEEDEEGVLEACRRSPSTDTERLLEETGLPLPALLRALTGLEIHGLITVEGSRVDLIRPNPIR